MNGNATKIDQGQLGCKRAAHHVVSVFGGLSDMLDTLGWRTGGHTFRHFLLVKTRTEHSIRAAFHRKDAVVDVRLELGENLLVILCKVAFRVPIVRPKNFIRM
jgi:hypothetical protein